jgi:hypothetical protein
MAEVAERAPGRAPAVRRGRAAERGAAAAAALAAVQQAKYHALLTRVGLSANANVAVEGIGLDALSSFSDLTEDDIPTMVKELQRTGMIIRQSSQNFLSALRYWVIRQDRLEAQVTSNDFKDLTMRYSLRRWQLLIEKAPKKSD